MAIMIIGKSGEKSYLIARVLKSYISETPVCIRRGGKWYYDKTLTLGVSYKYDLWEDQADKKNSILKDIPKAAMRHLQGLDN